jgi:hypothetical protein
MINLRSIAKKLWYNNHKRDSNLKCYCEDKCCEVPFDYIDHGIYSVPLKQIVGSVGKCHDFDDQFSPKSHIPLERYIRIKQLMRERKSLPPVKLYKIKDEYYVLDGNYRISAAKKLGRSDIIMAKVVEFIPATDTCSDSKESEQI